MIMITCDLLYFVGVLCCGSVLLYSVVVAGVSYVLDKVWKLISFH